MDIDLLELLTDVALGQNINEKFQVLIKYIGNYLDLDVIHPNIEVSYIKNDIEEKKEFKDILDLGVIRKTKNGQYFIKIIEKNKDFLPFIVLREGYYSFVPEILKENKVIKILINQILENDLKSINGINEWKQMVRERIINPEFLMTSLDRIDKFLQLQGTEVLENPVFFFFKFIRKNLLLINEKGDGFYDQLFKDYVFMHPGILRRDDLIETIRVLINIFYKVKTYRALLDYKEYFKQFKENSEIKTDLSLRKFTANITWINRYSYIAPSYKINWDAIGIYALLTTFTFNPLLKWSQISQIIQDLPFFENSKSSENNFSIEVSGWFMVPKAYLNDIISFIKHLEQTGFIIRKKLIKTLNVENNLNLNYFRSFYKTKRLINRSHREHKKKYEIKFKVEYSKETLREELSLLDFLILDRVKNWSITGYSFEKRGETIKTLKSDLLNEILGQRALISELKENIKKLVEDQDLKRDFLNFLDYNKDFGFFYIKFLLKDIILGIELIYKFLIENPNIKNIYQFKEIIKRQDISNTIEENNLINKKSVKNVLFGEIMPEFFQNKKNLENIIDKYKIFSELFTSIFSLKIFNLKAIKQIINDMDIVDKIFQVKEIKLKKTYETSKLKRITSKNIDERLDSYLGTQPSIIIPALTTTINTTSFSKYFIMLNIKDNIDSRKILDDVKSLFPRTIIMYGEEVFTKQRIIQVEFFLPNLNKDEKFFFISVLYNLLGNNILDLKRYFYDGFYSSFYRKDFYDFDNNEFFYSKDLFKDYLVYVKKILGMELKSLEIIYKTEQKLYWLEDRTTEELVAKITDRIAREQIDLSVNNINKVHDFNNHLKSNLLDIESFKNIKQEVFFKKYIKAIKFKPSFQSFGFSQYYLFIHPIHIPTLDKRLLFNNTFQNLKHPAYIEENNTLLIKFLFPYRNPNLSYINWLTKSKKAVSEYCLFHVKRIHVLFQFNYNLGGRGWDFDPNRFKTHIKKVLYDKSFNLREINDRVLNIGSLTISNYISPNSKTFKDLTEIYSNTSIDLKSHLATRNPKLVNKIIELLERDLILPYVKLKNIDIQDKISIILPELDNSTQEKLIKIFNFFNLGYINEIEGQYYIYGLNEERRFEKGLYLKLYLPISELSHFQIIFQSLFEYFGIKRYLILNDLVEGEEFLKSAFGDLEFLENYNPLKNLNWSEKDQRYINHKLFGENFEPKYPDLVLNENNKEE